MVIGAGSAGIEAAVALAKADWEVHLAEPGGVGGTCLWAGCVPKKSIYVSSTSWQQLSRDPCFGVDPGDSEYDWPRVMSWKRHTQTSVAGDQERMIAENGVDHVRAPAKFASLDEVVIAGKSYRPDAIVIASGARTILPPMPGIELADTSGSALSYPSVPETLTIVGSGYIGMEFAAAYSVLGTKVTVVEHNARVLHMFDPDVVRIAVDQLGKLGVTFHTASRVESLTGERGNVTTRFTDGDGNVRELRADRVLMAVGRRPNTDRLDLDAAGIQTDAHGRLVLDPSQRTTNPRVWAAGDASGKIQLKPAAEMAGRAVAKSILTGTPVPIDYGSVPSTVFTLPQLGQVGMSEEDAQTAGIAHHVRRLPFDSLPAAIIDDVKQGLVKLVFADDDGRLLGAAIAAPVASELMYACALGVRTRATEADFCETVGIHAAYSEGLNFAALGLAESAAMAATVA